MRPLVVATRNPGKLAEFRRLLSPLGYEPAEIAAMARKYGLQARFVSSDLSPYRFHAALTKPAAHDTRDGILSGVGHEPRFEKMERSIYCKSPS